MFRISNVPTGSARTYTSTSVASTRRRGASALTPRQKQAVKRIVSADKELFIKQTQVSAGDVTSTATFTDLTAIAQGDDSDQRLGDAIKLKRIQLMGNVTRDDGATTDSFDQVRFILFVWHPDDATDAPDALTDILESATLYHHQCYVLDQNKKRKFTVLWDKRWNLPPREGGDASKASALFKVNRKLKNVVMFNDGATTGRNKIYLMRIGFYVAGGDNSACNLVANVSYNQK